MLIVAISILSLLSSFFLPWHMIAALAAMTYSFRPKNHTEIITLSLSVTLSHLIAAFALDLRSGGLLSHRISKLFGLPFDPLFYLLTGLVPGLIFLSTSYVVLEGRNLVKRRPSFSEKLR